MQEAIHTEVYRGYDISIYPDYDTESPDNWGNEDVFLVAFHRNFSVERDGFSEGLCGSIYRGGKYEDESINHEARDTMKKYHVFNLEAYIHSGVRLAIANEGNFPDRQWDVSLLGTVFVSKSEARTKKMAKELAQGLIKTWNTYLEGSVYGFTVTKNGEDVESCWGFYEDDTIEESSVLAEARSHADYDYEQRLKKHVQSRKAQIAKHVPLSARQSLA